MDIEKYLQEKEISFKSYEHPAVYTCEEAEKYNKDIKGIHSKNLFLKNKKSTKFYLIIVPAKKKINLKELSGTTEDKLTFANEKDLKQKLKLSTGAVSPFGLINDEGGKINLLIDKEIWDSDYVSFHPNINTKTWRLSKQNFHKYINSLKNKLIIIK
ncbi:MAG: prolyl-tRNA synthetase associated domain-containing protein [Candidatus Diapherotrites archaeon]